MGDKVVVGTGVSVLVECAGGYEGGGGVFYRDITVRGRQGGVRAL